MTWMDDEPVRGGYPSLGFLALTGLERMDAALKGLMPKPPIRHLFGLAPESSDAESSTFVMPSSPWLQTAAGVFLPGTTALLADAPLGSAILTGLGPGQIAVTSDLTLNYLRPMFPSSGLLSSRARSIEVGRRLGLAEAVIEDGSGKAMAHSTTRCFIQSLPVPDEDIRSSIDEPVYGSPDPYERPLTTETIPPVTFGHHQRSPTMDHRCAGRHRTTVGHDGSSQRSRRGNLRRSSPRGSSIVNAEGRVVARATSSAVVMEGRSWMGAVIDEAEVRARDS